MKLSLNWAQQFSNVDLVPDGEEKLIEKIGSQLGEIEEVEKWGPRYQGILVVRVVKCQPHPNADNLSVCKIDDGGINADVKRDENGLIELVCGAPNVHPDILAVWIPPGGTVPSSLGKQGELLLEARDIRGVTSNGMLASLNELGIGDDHNGILIINPVDVGEELAIPGTEFKKLFKMEDTVIDIENKMFTHRPDLFGILGIARELAAIQHLTFQSPEWYKSEASFPQAQDETLSSEVKIPNLVSRFMAVAVKNVTVKSSPIWLQAALVRVGIRPINNVVDITNFIMQLTAQPMHAYDADKLKSISGSQNLSLEVRLSHKDEKVKLLGGKDLKLIDESTILITSNDVPVGIGGVMGGADTEVDGDTKNIVLECATFDMYSIRKTAMQYGLFTDAVTRFNKGQSPLQNDKILFYALQQVSKVTGGQVASNVKDIHGELSRNKEVNITADFVNIRLGEQLDIQEMADLLKNAEFEIQISGNEMSVTAPFWRTDIEIPEDVVEEVGRLFGYDHLTLKLPKRSTKPIDDDPLLETKSKIRDILSRAGANELLTYTFVPGDLMEKVGQSKDNAFKIANALSPDLQYYRQSLIPSLLDKVHGNIKAGFNHFALFEINPVHGKDLINEEDKLPIEDQRLALVITADDKTVKTTYKGAAFYLAKLYLEEMLSKFGINNLEFQNAADYEPKMNISKAALAPFEKSRTALVKTKDGQFIGELGEFKNSVRRNLKLPEFIAGFEVDVSQIKKLTDKKSVYLPIPKFPKVEQDLTLKVPANIAYGELFDLINNELTKQRPTNSSSIINPIDIYQPEKDNNYKNISFRISISSYERTLIAEEVNSLLDRIAETAKSGLGVDRI